MLKNIYLLIYLALFSAIKVKGQDFCIEGYIMDVYCIERGTLLDNAALTTLDYPHRHSVHCLVDIASCRNNGYEVLTPGNGTWCRAYRLDQTGEIGVIEWARQEGICGTCVGGGTQRYGWRAAIIGSKIAGTGDDKNPPMMKVTRVVPTSTGCGTIPPPTDVPCIYHSGGQNTTILAHGSLMLIGWGILLPTGVILAALLRHRPNALWFKLHVAFQILGLSVAFVGWVVALVYFTVLGSGDGLNLAHAVIGMITMILGLLQPINALMRPHPPTNGEAPTKLRRAWEIVHKSSGYIAVVLSIVTIWLGTNLIPIVQQKVIFQAIYGCALFLFLCLIGVLFIDKNKYGRDNKVPEIALVS